MTKPITREEQAVFWEEQFPGHRPEEYLEAADAFQEYINACEQIFLRIKEDPVAWKQYLERAEIQRELDRSGQVINTKVVDNAFSGSSFSENSLPNVPEVAEDPKCKRPR